jgi:hypothetical protein
MPCCVNHREPGTGALYKRREIAGQQRIPHVAERFEDKSACGTNHCLDLRDCALSVSLIAQHRLAGGRRFEGHRLVLS